MPSPDDVERLAHQLAASLSPEQQQAFLDAIMAAPPTAVLDDLFLPAKPAIGPAPSRVRGFRLRLDLVGAKPPVWRRLEVPGDLTLEKMHLVIQTAMGWLDSHLHRFRTGNGPGAPHFCTPFDVEEGEDGVLEDGVRLDQVLARQGDRLWYEYDFGDGWEHVLAVEAVTDDPPAAVRCLAGRMACPPEDCGGIGGYTELAQWVRGGCDPLEVPSPFANAAEAWDWLPLNWDPDAFDADEVTEALGPVLAEPIPVTGDLSVLLAQLQQRGNRALTAVLAREGSHGPTQVTEAEAARILEPFTVLLDVVGDGIRLTAANKLPPAVVEELATRTGVADWWIGKVNRENLTTPVAMLRECARTLGLVTVRHGLLAPTAIIQRVAGRPTELWSHVVTRLPGGRGAFDRQAGWLTLAVAGSGTPVEEWTNEVRSLLLSLGWRSEGPRPEWFPVSNHAMEVLELLAGMLRTGLVTGTDSAVAATARAAITGPG